MTFTYTNEDFKYSVSLDTVQDRFQDYLSEDNTIFASGVTLEEAIANLKSIKKKRKIIMANYSPLS